MSVPVPPPESSIPSGLWSQYRILLADYYRAAAVGNQVAMRTTVQQMQQLTSVSGQLREMLRALYPMIRPALLAAGAAWGTITVVMGQVGTFIATGVASAVAAFTSSPFLIMMAVVAIIVFLFWFAWYCHKKDMEKIGYPMAANVTPQNGFPANATQAAMDFRNAVRARGIGPLEVLEGRARWETA